MTEKELLEKEQRIRDAYKWLSRCPEGQTIIEDLKESFYDVHTFSPESENVNAALHMEGGRWVVGYILHQIKSDDLVPTRDNPKGTYL